MRGAQLPFLEVLLLRALPLYRYRYRSVDREGEGEAEKESKMFAAEVRVFPGSIWLPERRDCSKVFVPKRDPRL